MGQRQSQRGVKGFKGKQCLSDLSNYAFSGGVFMGRFGLMKEENWPGK